MTIILTAYTSGQKVYSYLNEINVNGSRVYVENGEVKTQLSEAIQKSGYMSVEESRKITLEAVKKIYGLNDNV